MFESLKRLIGIQPMVTPVSWGATTFLDWIKDKSMSRCPNDKCSVMWVYTFNELGHISSDGTQRWENKVVNCPNCTKPVYFWRGRNNRDWVRADGTQWKGEDNV